MARLQILQLPEGAGDDRPPFVLVVDQAVPQRVALGMDVPFRDYWEDLAAKIGARGVIVTPETVDIPANETTPLPEPLLRVAEPASADDAERAGITQIVYTHERTRLDLCSALRLDTGTPWRKLIEHVGARQQELAGVYRHQDDVLARIRDVSTEPEIMNAQQEHPSVWKHGYECGVRAAKAAARPRNEKASTS